MLSYKQSITVRCTAVDPLAAKFPHNSPYAFSENRVIDAIELEGLEKVLLFGGADFYSDGEKSSTLLGIESSIKAFSKANGINADVHSYSTGLGGTEFITAFNYVKENYVQGETVVIYGYSLGGVAATQLTKLLNAEGISVDLLITVDAASSLYSQPLNIPENVDENVNIYQTDRSKIGSRGYPSEPIKGNENTQITNYNYDEDKSVQGTDAHGAIDEDTKGFVEDLIKETLQPSANEKPKEQ